MTTALTPRTPLMPIDPPSRLALRGTPPDATGRWADTHRLHRLRIAYEASGGLLPGELVCQRWRARMQQPVSRLARAIVDQHVVHVQALGGYWLPAFQFDHGGRSVLPVVHQVLDDLRDVFTSDETADWFAQPNDWLDGRVPADVCARDPAVVFEAARVDRYIAKG